MKDRARRLAPAVVLGAVAALFTGANALYTVGQSQQAIVLRLGAPIRVVNETPYGEAAGLYAKWPFVDQVVRLDRRLMLLQGASQEVTTQDGRHLSVQAALSYRIVDPLRFYRTSDDGDDRAERLTQLLDASVTRRLTAAHGQDIVSDDRAALMQQVLTDVRRDAATDGLGVHVADAHLLQATPSAAEAQAVAMRMKDAESRQAADIRAQGEARKRELMAAADREGENIRDDGEQQALLVRGQGDAQRADILGAAYNADPDFARFFRRLEAYDQALNPANTTLILSSDNAFLDLFGHGAGPAMRPKR